MSMNFEQERQLEELAFSRMNSEFIRKALAECVNIDGPINMVIHRRDQMFLHSLRTHGEVDTALSQYHAIGAQQFNIISSIVEEVSSTAAKKKPKILDFACGFGRLARLLSARYVSKTVFCSEIQDDALAFCEKEFGAIPLASSYDPAKFQHPREFDVIWVASLFSHLPDTLFSRWLAALYDCVSDQGVLCFSVRGRDLLQTPASESDELVYDERSENSELSSEHYGTAYATEGYVRSAIASITGHTNYLRIPRCLANEQDLYIVGPGLTRKMAQVIRKGPWGWLDIKRVDHASSIFFSGWCADVDFSVPAQVELKINGRPYVVDSSIQRPDVAAFFGEPGMTGAGWEFRKSNDTIGPNPLVEVFAVSSDGLRQIVYVGELF